MRFTTLSLIIALMVIFSACKEEKVPEAFYPRNDHEAYMHSLEVANLLTTGLGNDWQTAAKKSLQTPTRVIAPYQEAFYLDANAASAMGYRFKAKRGQKVQVTVTATANEDTRLFIDLFRVDEDESMRHVATADKEALMLGFEPRKDGEYILRFQPELLRGGQFKVTIENVPTFQFPVAGKGESAIWSVWGDPRDGGRRKHEGIDIFAKRGTPIIAPVKGYIREVAERGIGGKIIWLRDTERNQSLYFAHLDKFTVKQGTYVQAGDTIGTVGNTGNARTTRPHLHFGVYRSGAVDPMSFVKQPRRKLRTVEEAGLLGEFARLKRNSNVKENPYTRKKGSSVSKHEFMQVIGVNRFDYHVRLADGSEGYVPRHHLTQASDPLEVVEVEVEGDLFKSLDENAHLQSLEIGEQLAVLGRHEDFWFVKNDLGQTGWITDEQKKARKPLNADPD